MTFRLFVILFLFFELILIFPAPTFLFFHIFFLFSQMEFFPGPTSDKQKKSSFFSFFSSWKLGFDVLLLSLSFGSRCFLFVIHEFESVEWRLQKELPRQARGTH